MTTNPSPVLREAGLRRIVMVRAGEGAGNRRDVVALTRFWEWAEIVISSPVSRARETAAILAGGAPVRIDPDLDPLAPARETPANEREVAQTARVCRFLERALEGPYASMLVVSHQSTIRAIVDLLVAPLPPDRPFPAEMVLLTRQDAGRWALGRRTSDPVVLRSPLEATGLSGRPEERPPERHVASLEIVGAER
jgi:broad specificity phosphatase PhoE